MKLLRIIRSAEWWEYKLPPVLAIAFATLLIHEKNIVDNALDILFVLFSVIIGAVYVSIINDVTDIKDDLTAGKKNRMAALPVYMHWLLPLFFIAIGLAFVFFFYAPHTLSMLLYAMPWLSFSLYSFRPARLKERGFWGVLADASGSHIFISLLMVSYVSFLSGASINWYFFTAVGIWAMCFGTRGILWHQFSDRNNDIEAHVKTFATTHQPQYFKLYEMLIFTAELVALFCILYLVHNKLTIMALAFYLILAVVRYNALGQQPVIVLMPLHYKPFQIVMLDYYQALLPLALVTEAAMSQRNGWIILIIYCILFPRTPYRIVRDMYCGLMMMIKRA